MPASKRTLAAADFAALWVTLVISITTYYLAASLVDMDEQRHQPRLQLATGATALDSIVHPKAQHFSTWTCKAPHRTLCSFSSNSSTRGKNCNS
jgi:cytosine/uracil/thiamine/allantoin permease